MFSDVKKKVITHVAIMSGIMLIMALLSLFFGITRTKALNIGEKGIYFTILMVSVFFIIGLVNALSFILGYKSMMSALGNPSDDEMDRMLTEAEPVDSKEVHMIYIADERILNFESLHTYEMRNIRSIKKASYTTTDNNNVADTSYGIELRINGRPRKDMMSFRMFTERDSAYDIVIAACERYGIYVEKR